MYLLLGFAAAGFAGFALNKEQPKVAALLAVATSVFAFLVCGIRLAV